MKFKQSVEQLKQELKPMSGKERLDHLWEYYKWVLAVAVAVIALISIVATSIYNRNVKTVFGGAVVNIYLLDETEQYLKADIEDMLQIENMERVGLEAISMGDLSADVDAATNALVVVAWVATQEIDYVIMDESALSYYLNTAVVSDLSQVLTQEQFDMFEGKLVQAQLEEDGPVVPVALDITDIDFLKDCYVGNRKVYIAFPNNTDHEITPSEFLDYLLAWKHEE